MRHLHVLPLAVLVLVGGVLGGAGVISHEQRVLGRAVGQAVAEYSEGGLLVVSNMRFEAQQLRAYYLPGECAGQRPADCRLAVALDYELYPADCTLSIIQPTGTDSSNQVAPSQPAPGWHSLQSVNFWCEDCKEAGDAHPLGFSDDAPLVSLLVRGAQKPGHSVGATSAGDPSVAVVLNGASVPSGQLAGGQTSASMARKLLDRDDDDEGEENDDDDDDDNASGSGTTGSTSQGCMLMLSGTAQAFSGCTSITGLRSSSFTLMWTVLPASDSSSGTARVQFGLNGTTDGSGYVAVGFPSQRGRMAGADAFILQDCDSCSSGAKIQGYYMSGTSQSSVNPGAKLASSDLVASRASAGTGNWLSGSFIVELDASKVSTNPLNFIFAAGPLSSSGAPLEHFSKTSADVALLGAGAGGSNSPGPDTNTPTGSDVGTAQPGCMLMLSGTAQAFSGCKPITNLKSSSFTLMWTVLPASDSSSGTARVQFGLNGTTDGSGYVAVGFPSRRGRMAGADAFILQDCNSCSSGAKIQGYYMSGTSQSSVNPGAKLASSDLVASRASAGTGNWLSGSFIVELDASKVSTSPLNFIFAAGPLSSGGAPLEHFSETSADVALVGAGAGGSNSPGPDTNTPTGSDVGTVSQSCGLAVGGSQTFGLCSSVSGIMGSPFNIMWQVLPANNGSAGSRRLRQATSRVRFGLNGTTNGAGYVAMGFPTVPGEMTNANAFILQDCSSCASGAKILGYWMSGTDQSDVTTPGRMPSSDLVASRTSIDGANWLAGSFEVELDQAALASLPLIFAVGPLSSSGSPLRHDVEGSADLDLQGGGIAHAQAGGDQQTKINAHAWLMTIAWGVLIPAGIIMARCFKELDPFWFKFHRAVQTLAFLVAVAGFALGFAIRGSWDTPYPVHRNLGVAVMALACAQMTALFARPLKTSRWRRYWNWNHHWLGRAATACAIANIYYGIIHMEELGVWAWATYTAVLGIIVVVWLVKDSMDFLQGRRALVAMGQVPADTTSNEVQELVNGSGQGRRNKGASSSSQQSVTSSAQTSATQV